MILFVKITYYGQHENLEIPFARQTPNAQTIEAMIVAGLNTSARETPASKLKLYLKHKSAKYINKYLLIINKDMISVYCYKSR